MRHFKITISGKVQGVFFRASAKREADAIGTKGFICNTSNRDVYAEVEGSEEALENFITWCRRGPTTAVVENIKIDDGKVQGFTAFEIRKLL